tara:strand:- start:482 stop:730 length:249 start_codon:yes stop_codon:yes gene_type:complete
MAKIKEEELSKLNNFVNQANQIQLQIGGLEAHKADLLKNFSGVTASLTSFQKELEKEYGQVNIDLTTGEIKEENVPADNKKD